ncbi:MAG: hypothetical protein ACRC54_05155 [Fusobacteriaceae bacterium]
MNLIKVNDKDYNFLKSLKKEIKDTKKNSQQRLYKIQQLSEKVTEDENEANKTCILFPTHSESFLFCEDEENLKLQLFLEDNFKEKIKDFKNYMSDEEGFEDWTIKCAMTELYNLEEFLTQQKIQYYIVFTKTIFTDVGIFLTSQSALEHLKFLVDTKGEDKNFRGTSVKYSNSGDLNRLIALIENLEFEEENNV